MKPAQFVKTLDDENLIEGYKTMQAGWLRNRLPYYRNASQEYAREIVNRDLVVPSNKEIRKEQSNGN